jgi:hypothetical protein
MYVSGSDQSWELRVSRNEEIAMDIMPESAPIVDCLAFLFRNPAMIEIIANARGKQNRTLRKMKTPVPKSANSRGIFIFAER